MKKDLKIKRQKRTRSKIHGTKDVPRLSVFRSNKHIYAQIINDDQRKTLLGVSEKQVGSVSGTKSDKAYALGKHISTKAKEKKIKKVVFDKGSYRYHGRVKAFAQGAREGGLQF